MKIAFLHLVAIVSIILSHSVIACGQDDLLPILSDGKKWRVSVQFSQSEETSCSYMFSVEKDTLINNKPVKKIACVSENDADNFEPQSFYCMEDNGVLTGLYLSPDHSGVSDYVWYEEPVLDMTANKGMVFPGLTVEKIDYITVQGQKRLRDTLGVYAISDESPVYWVEGIGASNSLGWIFRWVPKPTGSIAMRSYSVLSAYMIAIEQVFDGDNLIFTKQDFSLDTGIDMCRDDQDSDNKTYDIYGRSIINPAKGSIYIRNGKKIIQM